MTGYSQRVAELLHPLSAETFVADYLGKKFAYLTGSPDRFSMLMPWSTLNRLLSQHRLSFPRIRMMQEGRLVSSEAFVSNTSTKRSCAREIAKLWEGGATMVLDQVEELHDSVRAVAADLGKRLHVTVGANLYAAGARARCGFNVHWDNHDVFILQVSGRKHWRVYGATQLHPSGVFNKAECPTGSPMWESDLKPGDLLYLPRGWWHAATPCDEPSLHLSLGVRSPTGVDFLMWVGGKLLSREYFRGDVPHFASTQDKADFLSRLRSDIIDVLTPADSLDIFIRERNAATETRSVYNLPASIVGKTPSLEGKSILHFNLPRVLDFRAGTQPETIEIPFDSQKWAFHECTAELFQFIEDNAPLLVDEFKEHFAPRFSPLFLDGFIADLLQKEMVSIEGNECEEDFDAAAPILVS